MPEPQRSPMAAETLAYYIHEEKDVGKLVYLIIRHHEVVAEQMDEIGDPGYEFMMNSLQDVIIDLAQRRCDYSARTPVLKRILLERITGDFTEALFIAAEEVFEGHTFR